MNVGKNCYIDDKWIPTGLFTGLYDIEGKEIYTSNKISVCGCSSETAIVGKTDSGFKLFFGSDNGSVQWDLDEKTIKEHRIRVLL